MMLSAAVGVAASTAMPVAAAETLVASETVAAAEAFWCMSGSAAVDEAPPASEVSVGVAHVGEGVVGIPSADLLTTRGTGFATRTGK